LVEFADYSDDADLEKSGCHRASFPSILAFLLAMLRYVLTMLAMGMLASATGCHAIDFYAASKQRRTVHGLEPPRELSMVSLPAYRIEPPDMLKIGVVKLVPRNPYRIGPSDVLLVHVLGTLRANPINKYYSVERDGTLVLGAPYGTLRVGGLTVEEAEADLTRLLEIILREPTVSIQLARSAAIDQVDNVYPVQTDGTVSLANYGMVRVAGKTITEAREAIEEHLAQYFDSPDVSVEIVQYNSKSYYVVSESKQGRGTMQRFPITGNETVLDAIAQMEQGAPNIASKTIWVARPAPANSGHDQILPVDWNAITHGGLTATNYQILPGDRIYVADDRAIAAYSVIAKLTDPLGRLLGITSQGTSTISNAETQGRSYNAHRVN
jgi:polysaccharide biosynthesis/export protein